MEQTANCTPVKKRPAIELSSFALHIIAMALMLCDHMWATVMTGHDWLTWLGRLTFPIYAFMLVEGYFHTGSAKKYLKRLLIFALISEVPFDLMYSGVAFNPFNQNVLWTLLISLLCISGIEKCKKKYRPIPALILTVLLCGVCWLAGNLGMVDYGENGVLTALLFYFLRGRRWWHKLGQLAGMYYINWHLIKGLTVPLTVAGLSLNIPQQGMAVLALIPIWLYKGKQGHHSKFFKYFCYFYYPVHMLILYFIS